MHRVFLYLLLPAWLCLSVAYAQYNSFPPGVFSNTAARGGGSAALGLQTSVAAMWEFETTGWLDSSGAGNTLTASGTPPTSVSGGKPGNAVHLVTASSESLTHASNAGLSVGGGNFSVQCWVKAVSSVGQWCSKDNGGFANREFSFEGIFTSSNVYSCVFYLVGGGNQIVNSTVTLDANWHHLVMTWDGTTVRLYVDAGTAFTAVPISGGVASTSAVFVGTGGGGTFADADVDQFVIWKARVLTPTEIGLLYNSGSGLSWAGML
jgi:hypothetical protein